MYFQESFSSAPGQNGHFVKTSKTTSLWLRILTKPLHPQGIIGKTSPYLSSGTLGWHQKWTEESWVILTRPKKTAATSTQTWYSTLRTGTAGSWRRKRRPWTWWNTKAWGSCYTKLPWQSPDRASSTGNYRWPSCLTSWGPLKPLAIWPQWLSTTLSDSRWCPGTTLRTQKFNTPVEQGNNKKVTRSSRTG